MCICGSSKYVPQNLIVSERNHEDADCFVLAILSHGDEGKVYGTDGPISLSAVCHRFQSDSCPSLHGKPKIFLLQASFWPRFPDKLWLCS